MIHRETPETETANDFLIAQFSVLANHVIGLFNAATQRISAYLVLAGLVFAAATAFPPTNWQARLFVVGVLLGGGLVGVFVWQRTVYLLIQTVRYLRIVNGIRGHFAQYNPQVARLSTQLLPTIPDLPAWNQPVFDPGLVIVEIILATACGLAIYTMWKPTWWVVLIVAVAVWALLIAARTWILYRNLSVPVSSEGNREATS